MPPRRRAAGILPQLLLSPCWIKKEETSPGCTCVERGGAVRSALDQIFRDLNRREYDSINLVLVTLPLSNLQGYEDARPLPLSLLDQGMGDVTGLYVCSTRRCRPFGTRISGDLDHDEYDSINPVLLNASARDLQGYVDALPSLSLLDDSID